MSRHLLLGGIALLASALPASVVSASSSTPVQTQGEWTAWHGCWQPDAADTGELLCVVPDGGGVRMVTIQGRDIVAESRVVADGRSRTVRHDDCAGTERAYWSADGQRVFLTSELSCSEGLNRKSSGVFVFTSAREWLSVQAVTIGDQTATRTVRYIAVEPNTVPAAIGTALLSSGSSARFNARQLALAAVDEGDVQEAVNSIDPAAVQEWLDVTSQPYSLGGDDYDGQGAVYVSALDQVGRMSNPVVRTAPKVVHIVEQPVVHRTYVTHVHSCWDPFFSGFVLGGRVVSVGVSYGYPRCGRFYYSRYSPWGYDLYGWRYVHAPLLVVRHRPIIYRRGYDHYYRRDRDDRDYGRDHRGGSVTRDGYRRGDDRGDRNRYTSDRDNRDRLSSDRDRTTRDTRVITTTTRDRDRDVARPARVPRATTDSRPSRDAGPSRAVVRSSSGSQRSGGYTRSGSSSSGGGGRSQAPSRTARAR